MKEEKDYPYKESYTGTIVAILGGGLLGVIALVKWVIIPNFISIINCFVPNFWSLFGYFIIIWFLFKFLKFLWYPFYALLGKYSYIILIATIIYIFLQIS